MTDNKQREIEKAIQKINEEYRKEDMKVYNSHRRIIGYDLSLPPLLNLVLIQKEYTYKAHALKYIQKNKLTNWLLKETKYSNSTKKYTILGVY